ncbi:unnamed protein product [Phaedon cochleariae]|uniref:Uncharacterized protein n=1 Tax=Phaedon cochleariae TaxID=80249 RepID=A0A9N9SHQ5_PHACE|nr:unnamed protein product [Phaedon cochleariae]
MDDGLILIRFYFCLGFQQTEILASLALNHDINISLSTLKRKLHKLGLFRRKNFTDILEIQQFIIKNTKTHGQLHGYRWMHLKCLQNNLVVTQDMVRLLLQIIDPVGVDKLFYNMTILRLQRTSMLQSPVIPIKWLSKFQIIPNAFFK